MGIRLLKRLLETIIFAGLLVTVGCMALGTPVGVKGAEEGKMTVHIEASSFEYRPNNIKVPELGPLTLVVENISGIEHNITVTNPEGQVLKSVNLPPKKTTSVSIVLPAYGTYDFYCDKPFHAILGMKGQIQVGS